MRQKLLPPNTRRALARERLFAHLDETEPGRALWLGGAPGAGKSTLIASYLRARALACVWYSLDENDDDPAQLRAGLEQALQQAGLSAPPTQASLGTAGWAQAWAEQLAASPQSLWVVLDEVGSGAQSAALAELAACWQAYVPLVLSARSAPQGAWTALLARGQLGVLPAAELRLSSAEIAALLPPSAQREERALAIYRDTGGWAAAVAISVAHHSLAPDGELAAAQAFEALAEHFEHHVLSTLEAKEIGLLERLVDLPWVSSTMLDQLACSGANAQALQNLVWLGMLEALAGDTRALPPRYVPVALIRRIMRRRLQRQERQAERSGWRRHGAHALLQQGAIEEALRVLLDGNPDEAVELLLSQIEPLLMQGRFELLVQCVADGSRERLLAHPQAAAGVALAAAVFDQDWSLELLRETLAACAPHDALARACCAAVALIAYQLGAGSGSFAGVEAWIECFREHQPSAWPQATAQWRARIAAAALWVEPALLPADGRLQHGALAEHAEAMLENEALCGTDFMLLALGALAWLGGQSPDERRALRLVQFVESSGRVSELAPELAFHWLVERWQFASLHGLAFSDASLMRRLEEIADRLPDRGYRHVVLYLRAESLLERGGARAVLDLLQREAELDFESQTSGRAWLLKVRARSHLLLAEWEEARRDARKAMGIADALQLPELIRGSFVVEEFMARTGEGDWQGAVQMARAMSLRNRGALRAMWRCAEWFIQALEAPSGPHIARAFALARHLDWRAFFLPLPHHVARLCASALEQDIETAFVTALIRERALRPPARSGPQWPWLVRVHLLGEFRVVIEGRVVEFDRKTPRKPLDLLRTLALAGNAGLEMGAVGESLWPDEDGWKKSLESAIARLRKLLGTEGAVVVTEGRVRLDESLVFCDVRWANEFYTHYAPTGNGTKRPWTAQDIRRLKELNAPLAPGDDHIPAVIGERARLAGRWRRAAVSASEQLVARAEYEQAADLCGEVRRQAPTDSRATALLIQALDALGDRCGMTRVLASEEQRLRMLGQALPQELAQFNHTGSAVSAH